MMFRIKNNIGQSVTKKEWRCNWCENSSLIYGAIHCNGYRCFNHWAVKCAEDKIKGKFIKRVEVEDEMR